MLIVHGMPSVCQKLLIILTTSVFFFFNSHKTDKYYASILQKKLKWRKVKYFIVYYSESKKQRLKFGPGYYFLTVITKNVIKGVKRTALFLKLYLIYLEKFTLHSHHQYSCQCSVLILRFQ